MKRTPSRQFITEYKTETVKRIFEQQIPRVQVILQVGISINLLHNRVAQHELDKLQRQPKHK